MNNYPDNYIDDSPSWVDEMTLKELEKTGDWLPFPTYDMLQSGYPYPDHGVMIQRYHGDINEDEKIHPPKGMWCKVEDVKAYLRELNESLTYLYDNLTFGKLSKANTDPIYIVEVVNQRINESYDEGYSDGIASTSSEE